MVNNAGLMLLGPFSAELSADYRRMIETNLLGAITTTDVFLDLLLADDGGDLVVIKPGAVATELTDHITHSETKSAAEQMYEASGRNSGPLVIGRCGSGLLWEAAAIRVGPGAPPQLWHVRLTGSDVP